MLKTMETQGTTTKNLTDVCRDTVARIADLELSSGWPRSGDVLVCTPDGHSATCHSEDALSFLIDDVAFNRGSHVVDCGESSPKETSRCDCCCEATAQQNEEASHRDCQSHRVEKRKRQTNIFAWRLSPDQCPDALKRYLDAALRTTVTCTKLNSEHRGACSSFLVVIAEVDNPRSLLDGQLWPEDILVQACQL